ncbi:putative SUC2-invertase [Violaceomyces palustris]|uniref:SUC2-invertase n=1 Tax=Violaceomyces palustris TaxID=1673888 RepID=A0ACD0P4Y1_9BASI|nr:putative SUC2-invertase [Violaceomyces palustris]
MWSGISASLLATALLFASPRPGLSLPSSLHSASPRSNYDQCVTSNGTSPYGFNPPLYKESHRPQIHFSPSTNFMNDPNGLVYSNGSWHLFYQYNPTDPYAGNQHWGHAISKDLYHWENLPMALAPETATEGIFSGSAIVDRDNTSGLFTEDQPADQRIVTIYTLNNKTSEEQHIAYTLDGGVTFQKYPGAVLSIGSSQFRDPKVFWDKTTESWVMATAHAQDFEVVFYSSKDLKDWTELSRFSQHGILGYQYECPDLFEVPIKGGSKDGQKAWVLGLSINPGAPLGGSMVQYFPGDWDGKTFTPWDGAVRFADFSKDFYAFQTWSGSPDGKTYGIAWASNWQYTNVVPTQPYRSIQSLPREIYLEAYKTNPMFEDYVLSQAPASLETIKGETLYQSGECSSQNKTIELVGDGAFDVQVTFSLPPNVTATYQTIGSLNFKAGGNKDQSITTGVQFGDPTFVYIDRSKTGSFASSNPFMTDKTSGILRYSNSNPITKGVPTPIQGESLVTLRAIIDRSVLEVFGNDGQLTGTSVFFFDDDQIPKTLDISIGDDKIKIKNVEVVALKSTWPECP